MGEEDIYTYTAPALCGARLGCARERQSAVVQLVYSVYTYTVAVGMSQIRTAVCHTDAN